MYINLPRKWRPQTFDDLVGQQHIARTIASAIRLDRVSQGYLFAGTRGIGKTSSARIFAKALRCTQSKSPGVPCGVCQDCKDIADGRSVDVMEIDGASNNGVDAVRELRESAKYLPATGKFKIYIIDEVHMLSTAAFNALLKTLEEPPPHVVFIFATTDPQKIPITVLSRCQRYDFKRVTEKDLKARLAYISQQEKISISEEALAALAREADGSMRDALSLLDQVASLSDGGEISLEALTQNLGLVDKKLVLECLSGILQRRPLDSLTAAEKVYNFGYDLKQFSREILRLFRLLLICQILKENNSSGAQYLDIAETEYNDLQGLIGLRTQDDLDYLFRVLNHGLEDISRSSIPKIVLDIVLMKMATAQSFARLMDFVPSAEPPRVQQSAQPVSVATPVPAPVAAKPAAPNAVKPAAVTAAPAATSAPASPQAASTTPPKTQLSLQDWKDCVQFVKSKKPMIGSLLEHMALESCSYDGKFLILLLSGSKENSFYKQQMQQQSYKDSLMLLLSEHLKVPVRFEMIETTGKSLAQMEEESKQKKLDEHRTIIMESEPIQAARQLLGAKIEHLIVEP